MNVSMVRRRRSPTSIASAIEILILLISNHFSMSTLDDSDDGNNVSSLSLARAHTHTEEKLLSPTSERANYTKGFKKRFWACNRATERWWPFLWYVCGGDIRKEGRGGTGSIDFRPSVILSPSFVSTASQWRDRLNTPMGSLSSIFAWVWRFFFHLQKIDVLNSYRSDLIIASSYR